MKRYQVYILSLSFFIFTTSCNDNRVKKGDYGGWQFEPQPTVSTSTPTAIEIGNDCSKRTTRFYCALISQTRTLIDNLRSKPFNADGYRLFYYEKDEYGNINRTERIYIGGTYKFTLDYYNEINKFNSFDDICCERFGGNAASKKGLALYDTLESKTVDYLTEKNPKSKNKETYIIDVPYTID